MRWIRSYYADDPKAATKIGPNASFRELFDLDSLDYVDWVLEAESIFGVAISDRDAEKFTTVGEFLDYLRLAGAQWRSDQDIEITKGRFGGPDYKVVNRPTAEKRPV